MAGISQEERQARVLPWLRSTVTGRAAALVADLDDAQLWEIVSPVTSRTQARDALAAWVSWHRTRQPRRFVIANWRQS